MVVPSGRVGGDHVTFQYCVAGVLGVGEEENSGRNPFPFLLLESRTGNPLSPEPFVSRAKALTAKRSEKGMGTRIYLCKIISCTQIFHGQVRRRMESGYTFKDKGGRCSNVTVRKNSYRQDP